MSYQLPHSAAICRISFLPRTGPNARFDCPSSYKFEGSDDGVRFETILFVEKEATCIDGTRIKKSFLNDKAFKHYRLMILDVPPGRGNKKKFVVIRDLRFYCCVSKSKGTGKTLLIQKGPFQLFGPSAGVTHVGHVTSSTIHPIYNS